MEQVASEAVSGASLARSDEMQKKFGIVVVAAIQGAPAKIAAKPGLGRKASGPRKHAVLQRAAKAA